MTLKDLKLFNVFLELDISMCMLNLLFPVSHNIKKKTINKNFNSLNASLCFLKVQRYYNSPSVFYYINLRIACTHCTFVHDGTSVRADYMYKLNNN